MRLFYAAALILWTTVPALAQNADQNWIQAAISNVDAAFGSIVSAMSTVLFADLGTKIPLIIWVLVLGGIYYSFYFGWISLRGFRHSIDVIRGRYDDPNDPGEISHFQALTSALSATIGLGNIAGVAIAVSLGGPGAVFWMLLTALFGMSSKLASCTLAVMHRKIHPDGRISGGPMYYLEHGLAAKGLKSLGRVFAILFAIFAIGGALGGGNMFQVNQTIEILTTVSPAVGTTTGPSASSSPCWSPWSSSAASSGSAASPRGSCPSCACYTCPSRCSSSCRTSPKCPP